MLWKMIVFSLSDLFLYVQSTETAKYIWLRTIGVKIEFWFAFQSKIMWKVISGATNHNLII